MSNQQNKQSSDHEGIKKLLKKMSQNDRVVPVFVNPTELTFYVENQETHHQQLAIYNPYNFLVKYQVFSNAPLKYTVDNANGLIAAQSYVELKIQHNEPSHLNCCDGDKLMVTICDANTAKVLGKRYVSTTLIPGAKDDCNDDGSACDPYRPKLRQIKHYINRSLAPWQIYVISFCFLLIGLLLMSTRFEQSEILILPSCLHISASLKLIISYLLGLITMLTLKPH